MHPAAACVPIVAIPPGASPMHATLTTTEHETLQRAEVAHSSDSSINEGTIAEPEATTPRAPRPLFRLDAGWPFLLTGIGILAATVIIPAQHDLDVVRWQRDRALAIEHHRMDRLERYGTYLAALEKNDETVMLSLAASQLNKSPADRIPLEGRPDPARSSASVFPELEPGPVKLPEKPAVTERSSLLSRWAIDDSLRLWMLAGGMLCVLIGVLPPSVKK